MKLGLTGKNQMLVLERGRPSPRGRHQQSDAPAPTRSSSPALVAFALARSRTPPSSSLAQTTYHNTHERPYPTADSPPSDPHTDILIVAA